MTGVMLDFWLLVTTVPLNNIYINSILGPTRVQH